MARAGDRIYVLSGSMLEEASIAAKIEGMLFGVKIAEAQELVRATIDANEKRVDVKLNSKVIEATAPLKELLKDKELLAGAEAHIKNVDVHLEPMGIEVSVHVGEKKIDFSRIEMSDKPYYINHDGRELASVTFPSAKAVAVKIEEISGGMNIELSSAVSVKVATKLAELSNVIADFGGDILDEVVTIDITGAAPKFEGGEQFKVASGQVSITSKAANSTLVVQEGQCLEFQDGMSEHWLLNGSAGACRF
jgi:ribosome-associated translation inhibitor RaiA